MQRVVLTRVADDCTGMERTIVVTLVEMFNPARTLDTLSAFDCTEVDADISWEGEVAIVDLDELPTSLVSRIPDFRSN